MHVTATGGGRVPIVGGFVMPISPVLVPEVGRGRERQAVKTVGACRRAGRALRDLAPEAIVLILPGDSEPTVFHSASGTLRRPFDHFDALELVREDALDRELTEALRAGRPSAWTPTLRSEIPHNALAALYFLIPDASAPLLVLTVGPGDLHLATQAGADVRAAFGAGERRVALVACGELSNRIFPGAPGGYEPSAARFDERVVEAFLAGGGATIGGRSSLTDFSADERTNAGERLLPQLCALVEALPWTSRATLLSYEHPFGVGYLVASVAPAG